MSFVLDFLPEALAEVECITGDYEARSVGLGSRFRAEIESVCVRPSFNTRCFGDYDRVVTAASTCPDFHTTSHSSPTGSRRSLLPSRIPVVILTTSRTEFGEPSV